MHSLNLTDETFDVNQSNNYFLLMQSSLNGFSYAICDSVRNKCILLKHFETHAHDWFDFKIFLLSILESEELLKHSYKSVRHIINRKEFTIIPELFVPRNEHELQSFFPDSDQQGEILIKSASESAKSTILSPYPAILAEVLQNNIKNIKLSHQTLPFVNYLVNESSRSLRHIFYLMVEDDFITIGVAHSGTLDFVNSFKIQSIEDIVYFLVSVLEKFRVTASLSEVFLINESGFGDLNAKLQAYIGKVRNLKPSRGIVFSYIFTEDILERFSNMLNLYHCE